MFKYNEVFPTLDPRSVFRNSTKTKTIFFGPIHIMVSRAKEPALYFGNYQLTHYRDTENSILGFCS